MTIIEITGGKELAERLKALPGLVSKKFMKEALREGAKIILGDVIYACPSKTGASVAGLHISMSSRGGETKATVQNNRDQYYLIMYEKGAKGPGKRVQPARPFMSTSFEGAAGSAVDAIAADIKGNIEDSMKE
jgi:hypothetical protein